MARENSGLASEAAIAARFQPGHIPANKGRKMEEFLLARGTGEVKRHTLQGQGTSLAIGDQ